MRCLVWSFLIAACPLVAARSWAERINQEGRILGPEPAVDRAVLFNTPEADAILGSMQIMPVTSAWNEDISRRPVLPNSDAMIARIQADLSASRRTLRAFQEMNFVLVPDSQPPVPIQFVDYPDESDPGPYPIPANMPVETWPSQTGGLTLDQWQRDVNNTGGDRHSIVVQPGAGLTWETWQARLVGAEWQASNGAKFSLHRNDQRPAGWTSGDAAGLPMFPALVRFDECQRGLVEHACRLVVAKTRREYLYPANHYASTIPASQTNVPAMGQRLRLKANFAIPESWSREEKAVLLGLKKYGAIVADNGGFFSISITPDHRWPPGAFGHLSSIGITNFEVVRATGPTEGPRSPGAPSADAGPDLTVPTGVPVSLGGSVTAGATRPDIQWRVYAGPGSVHFRDATQAATTATFQSEGRYVLLLSADDGIHARSYDAVRVLATHGPRATATRFGAGVKLEWAGGQPPYTVEHSDTLAPASWNPLVSTNATTITLPAGKEAEFFRVTAE
jgi:hypothetical protein